MAEALEKIQSIFRESKTLALISKKNSEDYKLLAKEAFKNALLEKKIGVIDLPEHSDFQKKWKLVIPEKKDIPVLRQTSIRIPRTFYKIKEISYEDSGDTLSLLITTESKELDKNIVTFERILPKADAVFCFFDPYESETLQELEKKIILPPKEKIVFFTSNGITFAEKISQIIKTSAPDIFLLTETATLLFASLISETNNFNKPISQEVLRFGSELLSLGADKESVKTILNEEKTISFVRLLGRALARTHIDETPPSSWTFLSQKDLEKTENHDAPMLFFYNIARSIRDNITYCPLSLLFWQTSSGVYAMATSDEEKELVPLAGALGVKLQSRYFTAGAFNNFSEAELRFKDALKEIAILKI